MKNLRSLLVLFFAFKSAIAAPPITTRACPGGGEGGVPLLDLSHLFPKTYQQVPTSGGVEEFVYWENRDQLIYRDSTSRIASRDFKSSSTSILDPRANPPISRLVDPGERYVLIEKDTRYLDVGLPTPYWHQYTTKYPVYKHLFWAKEAGDDVLYTWSNLYNQRAELQTLIIYRYGTGDKEPTSCKLPLKPGEKYFAGEGHVYPDAFVYKVRPTANNKGTEVSLYNIRIGKSSGGVMQPHQCQPIPVGNRIITVPGNVTGVYQLPNQNGAMGYSSYAIKTDHPLHNLLWIYKTSLLNPPRCHSFNFGGREPHVLNTKRSVVATWAEGEGITLIYPQRKEQAKIFPGIEAYDLKETDFWLSDSGEKIFVAAKHRNSSEKKLYTLSLPR